MAITVAQLKTISPRGNDDILQGIVDTFPLYADKFGINTPLRKAHFFAQLAHESDGYVTTKEYGGAKSRYAPWYGRGLIQTTWEENYAAFTAWCKKHGIESPNFATTTNRDKVALFPWALLSAICYWDEHGLNKIADEDEADDIVEITKKINGGKNGLEDRKTYYARARSVFGLSGPQEGAATPAKPATGTYPVLEVQEALVKLGYKITADGDWGPRTQAAVTVFQKLNGLKPDGVVGPETAKVLFK